MRKNTRYLAAALAAGALVTIGAGSASAHTTGGTVTAQTKTIDRGDSGGAGNNWAYDSMGRKVTITYLGKAGPAGTPYQYEATVTDAGTFKTIPGQLTPNQGGRYAGTVEPATQITGSITGGGDYSLDASAKVNSPRTWANLGVPTALRGLTQNGLYPTGTWPELAFPAGTTFAGPGLFNWGWTYKVPAKTVTVNGHKHTTKAQTWVDSLGGNAGQDRGDGQIG